MFPLFRAIVKFCSTNRLLTTHLELVPDLQGSNFIRSLKRFTGRRGIPARIISDNGKAFSDYAVQLFVNSRDIGPDYGPDYMRDFSPFITLPGLKIKSIICDESSTGLRF